MAVIVEIVPVSVNLLPTNLHITGGVKEIPITCNPLPSGLHDARGIKIIPDSTNHFPIGNRCSVFVIIPFTILLLPAVWAFTGKLWQNNSTHIRDFVFTGRVFVGVNRIPFENVAIRIYSTATIYAVIVIGFIPAKTRDIVSIVHFTTRNV